MANFSTCNGTIALNGSVIGTDVVIASLVDGKAGNARCHQKHERFGKRLSLSECDGTNRDGLYDDAALRRESLRDSQRPAMSMCPTPLTAPAVLWASMVVGGRAMSS